MKTAKEILNRCPLLKVKTDKFYDYNTVIKAMKEYAIEVAKQTQRNCAENFDIEDLEVTEGGMVCYDRIQHNILSETNIPKLD